MQVEGKVDAFCLPVCLICDRVIIGCETVHKLAKKAVLATKSKFSIEKYNTFYDMKLHAELIKQYEVEGLEGLLLSPRATKTTNACTGDVHYSTCSNCYNSMNSMKNKKSDNPPSHAIANGFAIGQVPTRIIKNEDITEEMCSLLAPIRPYAYLFAYSAGAHKSIRGHYSFFEMDLTHTGSVMNHFLKIGSNPMVYVVLNGRMTPKQKELVRQRAELDTSKMMQLLDWFVTESGHPAYANVPRPSECPKPVVMEDKENANNTDNEMNPEVEHTFAGASYHFASSHDPNEDTGVYETNQKFVSSMLDRTMPTLLVSGGEYANLKELELENVTPLQFPFGQGGPKQSRRTRISYLECFKLYSRLSLKQFMRADFLLILNHMHGRLCSFNKAIIKCKSQNCGTTLAEKISTLDIDDLNRAMMSIQTGQDPKGTAAEYIKTIKASCEPIGHSAEAAKKNRRRHFAICDYLGESSLFVTTTPCDECTLRVGLFVNAGEEQTLPPLGDLDDKEHINQCKFHFELRKRYRTLYPGACSLVYQHLMQIVTECLIGWNTKTKTGRVGVLGKPLAWSRTDEEQARKTLHAHWQIWIEYFNDCREALFSDDEEERKKARDMFIQYVDSVICASYPDYTVAHVCKVSDGKETTQILRTQPVSDLFKESDDKNVLRKARHKDHCLIINCEVLNCKQCGKAYSPRQCMEMAIAHWRRNATQPQTKEEEEEKNQQGMKGENNDYDEEEETHTASSKKYTRRENKDQKVWLDQIAIRHPYDFDEEGMPSEALKAEIPDDGPNNADIAWLKEMQARSTLLHYRFDEHDHWHRATCFKKDSDCRANLPMMASDTTFIHDNDTLPDTLKQMQQPTTNNNLDNEQQQQNDSTSRSNAGDSEDDRGEQEDHLTSKQIRNVRWHYLDGTTKVKSQYAVIPKRGIGSEFLNAHNIAMSSILGCNTNVTIGDASHTYYCTLYKSKDTQAEDKEALLRVHGSFGRRIMRRKILLQQQQQQAAEEREQQRKSQQEQEQDGNEQASESDGDDTDDKDECHAEGLGRVMTGVNALLSRNVVSPTMAHLLVSQGGTRFTYSHGEENLLVTQLEDYLDGKECNFILRTNYNKIEKRRERWPDSTAYDYVFRPQQLERLCYYEYMMKYKKGFKKFKQINREQDLEISGSADCNDEESSVQIEFQDGHPGKRYAFLTKRKFPVIPTIMMRNGRLCDVELLEIGNSSPSFNTARYRENYAKQALMMFLPFTVVDDLSFNGSHWEKFIAVGGTKCYDAKLDCQDGTPAGCMWEYGKRILENIQTRKTVKSKMKRPPDPLTLGTKRPQSTGERMRADIDDEVRFDADFSEYCIDDDDEDDDTHNGILEPLAQNAKRSHKTLIDRANVNATKLVQPIVAPGATLIDTSDNAGDASATKNTTTTTRSTQRNPLASYSPSTRYGQLLTFIQGTLVGGRNRQESTNTNRPWWDTDRDDPTLTMTDDEIAADFDRLWDEAVAHAAGSKEKNTTNSIPTLQQVANESRRNLDDKQYVAYQIISCTFLIQLINEGGDTTQG